MLVVVRKSYFSLKFITDHKGLKLQFIYLLIETLDGHLRTLGTNIVYNRNLDISSRDLHIFKMTSLHRSYLNTLFFFVYLINY